MHEAVEAISAQQHRNVLCSASVYHYSQRLMHFSIYRNPYHQASSNIFDHQTHLQERDVPGDGCYCRLRNVQK